MFRGVEMFTPVIFVPSDSACLDATQLVSEAYQFCTHIWGDGYEINCFHIIDQAPVR